MQRPLDFRVFLGLNSYVMGHIWARLALFGALVFGVLVPNALAGDFIFDVYSTTFTGVTSGVVDPGGYKNGVFPSNSPVFLVGYTVLSVGGDAQFTVSQTTRTYPVVGSAPAGFNTPYPGGWAGTAPSITTSTVKTATNGQSYAVAVPDYIFVTNPILNFTLLQTAATVYIDVAIKRPKI